MALISASTLITSASLFHLTLAYFFLTDPAIIENQSLVFILGESMGIPDVRGFETRSPALALVSGVLILVALGDIVSLSMPEEVALVYHWGTQAPLRFFIALLFIFYVFVFGPSSPAYASNAPARGRFSAPSSNNPAYIPSGWGGDGFKNRVFFTFMFVEMLVWFWIWLTLREERDAIIEKNARQRRESNP